MTQFDTIPAPPTPPAHTLTGPAHADSYRVKVGRFRERWYTDPLDACDIAPASEDNWPAISTVKQAAGFDAAEYVVMKRLAQADLSQVCALPVEERYERYKALNKAGRNVAFYRGNGAHAAAEAILYGAPVTLREGDPGYNYLPAIQAFFDDYQPSLIAAEFVAINRGVGYGGTADAGVLIDGKPTIIDWKTRGEDSDHGAYPEEAAQIAALMGAEYYIVEGASGAPERRLLDWEEGLIVSIKPEGYEVHPVNFPEAFKHWRSLVAWWRARRVEHETIARKLAPRGHKVEPGVAPSPPPPAHTRAPVRKAKQQPPDEGAEVGEADVAALKARYGRLDPAAKAWTGAVVAQGNAGHSWRINEGKPTVRRYELYRGVLALAEWGDPASGCDDNAIDDIVRAAVHLVTGIDATEFPTTSPGEALGLLDVGNAAKFAAIVDDLTQDRYVVHYDDGGTPRLEAA